MENKKEPLRILLADDHRVLRKGLSLLLSSEEDFSVVRLAGGANLFAGGFRIGVKPVARCLLHVRL